jgi:hypothetical protein
VRRPVERVVVLGKAVWLAGHPDRLQLVHQVFDRLHLCQDGRLAGSARIFVGGKTLVDAGAVMADDLSARKARILLMLLLQNGVNDQKGLQVAFSK